MILTLTIPDELAAPLQAANGNDLSRAAIERLALAGYQSAKLNTYQVQKLLGFSSRIATQRWLGQMGAHESYSLEDLEDDRRTLDRHLPR
jgi:hypothetical protein